MKQVMLRFSTKENLMGWVDLFSLPKSEFHRNHEELLLQYGAQCIVLIGDSFVGQEIISPEKVYLVYPESPASSQLANDVAIKVVQNYCLPRKPLFSIFTPAYMTGERIFRTYNSLKSQTLKDWEWVVVDDSPQDHNTLWENLLKISSEDSRVKPHRINPNTSGVVGKAKSRACSLSTGDWLVELDHDDTLVSDCLETLLKAANKFPDAGFIYSDCTEIEADGRFRTYDDRVDWNFYGAACHSVSRKMIGPKWTEKKFYGTIVHL